MGTPSLTHAGTFASWPALGVASIMPADVADGRPPEPNRIAAVRGAVNRLQIGRLADAALAGALVALVLAGLLGGVKLDVLGALGTLCVLLVLLLLAVS